MEVNKLCQNSRGNESHGERTVSLVEIVNSADLNNLSHMKEGRFFSLVETSAMQVPVDQ